MTRHAKLVPSPPSQGYPLMYIGRRCRYSTLVREYGGSRVKSQREASMILRPCGELVGLLSVPYGSFPSATQPLGLAETAQGQPPRELGLCLTLAKRRRGSRHGAQYWDGSS